MVYINQDILNTVRDRLIEKFQPQKIVIFGIEPASINPQPKLSKTVAAKMDDYIAAICEELAL